MTIRIPFFLVLAALLLVVGVRPSFAMQALRHVEVRSERPFLVYGPAPGWSALIGGGSMLAAGLSSKATWASQSAGQRIGTSTLIGFGASFILVSPFVFQRRRFAGSPDAVATPTQPLTKFTDAMETFERDYSGPRGILIFSSVMSSIGILSSESAEDRRAIAVMGVIPLVSAAYQYYIYRNQRSILRDSVPELQGSLMLDRGHLVPALAMTLSW